MMNRQAFSFLKSFLIFLIDRLYKEWEYLVGKGRCYNEKDSERGDLYAKQLIENIIHDRGSKYDPYILDGDLAISCGTTSVVLGKARVIGLSSLHRNNVCSLTEVGNRLFINANLGAGPLTYQRQIALKFGNLQRQAAFLVSLTNIKVSIDFSVERKTGRNGFLLKFVINELNGLKLILNGPGYFDWAINLFFSFWMLVLGRIVRNLLENELEQYILKRLPKYQFPVEGLSYQNENNFNNQCDVKNNGTSLSAPLYSKQCLEKQQWSRSSPIGTSSVYEGNDSAEYATKIDFSSSMETTMTSSFVPETNKWTTELDSFYLREQSLGTFSGSLYKNSCAEVPQDKAEEECDTFSELSRKSPEIFRSLDSMWLTTESWSKEVTSKNCVKILEEACSLFDWNVSGKSKSEVEYSGEENRDPGTSSSKGFENEQSLSICEKRENVEKSKMEDLSQMLLDSNRSSVKRTSEVVNQNPGQSKLLEEIFSEIYKRSAESVDVNAIDMTSKLPNRVANCNSSPLMVLESSKTVENVLEPSNTETGTFLNLTRNFDSGMMKARIDHLEKMFLEKKRERKNEDSSNNRQVSPKMCSHFKCAEGNFSSRKIDLKSNADVFQKESFISCTADEFENPLNPFPNNFFREYESKIENSDSMKSYNVQMPNNQGLEAQCNFKPRDSFDDQTFFGCNIDSDSMQGKMIKDEKSFDLKSDAEKLYTSFQFREKHENEVSEKIPFGYVVARSKEVELNENSEFQLDEDYSEDSLSSSEESISSVGFPAQSLDLRSVYLKNNLCNEVSKDDFEGKCEPSPEISNNSLKTYKLLKLQRENLESIDRITNSWVQESSLLKELACLNEREIKRNDGMVEFLSIGEMKYDGNLNKNSLTETPDLKPLHDIQEEIIAKTRKVLSDVVLKYDPEDDECSNSFPLSSYKDLECEKEISDYDEINVDSKADLEVHSLIKD